MGGGRQKKSRGEKNTINGHGSSSWRNESPWELMHCGEVSRLGAVRSNEVGRTRKSDEEICDFVANYLSKHRTYHMITEMLGSVNFDNKNGYSMVPNCPWCQIVRGAKLSVFGGGAKLSGAKLSWCQIVRGAKLSAVPNCPVPNCPVPNCPRC